jgi:G3E family GTPase
MKNKLYLINGPLGAGKTTLLKFLLQQKELANAQVIENEFASSSVDSEELHDHVKDIETIAGLCICCSTGTLKLIEKLIVNDTLQFYDIAKAFFVIDAAEVFINPLLLISHREEIEAADIVVITKTDLLAKNQQSTIVHDITQLSRGEVVVATMGAIDPVLIAGSSGIVEYFANSNATLVNHDTDTNYSLVDVEDMAFNADSLQAAWNKLQQQYGLKRLKGAFTDATGAYWHVEATQSQFKAHPQKNTALLRLVFIGSDARSITQQVLKEIL